MEIKTESKQHDEVPNSLNFLSVRPYVPPSWASHLNPIPTHLSSLARLPTPIHKWNLPNLPNNTEVWLKTITLCTAHSRILPRFILPQNIILPVAFLLINGTLLAMFENRRRVL